MSRAALHNPVYEIEQIREYVKRCKWFRYYIKRVFKDVVWHRHIYNLASMLESEVVKPHARIMIMMPPRFGKSLLASRLLPAWYLTRFPKHMVGLACYGHQLAQDLARDALFYYKEGGGLLHPSAGAATSWRTSAGGGMWAAGAGGAITGRGADLAIIDDLIKGRQDADSELRRERVWDWYRAVFYTRLEQGARLVVIGTRWHERDLIGMLLEEAEATGEKWHVVMYSHEYDPSALEKLPESCTVQPDRRKPGELLAPRLFNKKDVARMKAVMGSREWASLHQQRPVPKEGAMFKYSWLHFVEKANDEARRRVRYWDLAGTEGSGDYTAGALLSEKDGHYRIENIVRGQWSPGKRDDVVVGTAARDSKDTEIWIERESGIGGAQRTQSLAGKLAGYVVRTEPATGSKEHRAEPMAAQAEAGNLTIVRERWTHAFVDELLSFGAGGEHDDQVDAASGAFNQLALGPGKPKLVRSPWA